MEAKSKLNVVYAIQWCKMECLYLQVKIFSLPLHFFILYICADGLSLKLLNDCLKGTKIIAMQRDGITLLHFWAINVVPEIEKILKSKYELSTLTSTTINIGQKQCWIWYMLNEYQ